MSTLMESVKSYLTSELIGKVAGTLGESENGISKASTGLVASILGGLLNKSGDSGIMNTVFSLLKDGKSTSVLGDLGALIGQGNLAHNDPKDISGKFIGALFGNKVPDLINGVSSFAGIKNSSVSSLLGMIGPLVMGVLGKKIASGGLNLSSLTSLLSSEKSSITSLIPSGLGSALGLSSLMGSGQKSSSYQEQKSSGTPGWLWPLLLALGAIVAFMMWKGCNKPKMPEVPVVNIDSIAQKAGDAVEDAATVVTGYMHKLKSGFEIKGNTDGIENSLISFIESDKVVDKTTWFNFDRLTFKTGSDELDMDLSKDQLNNMYEILKEFSTLKLKIGGYTDNTGKEEANMKLSQRRADAVVTALTAMGIDKARLEPEGYGSHHPVASNDTEEGRAQNRRIAVRVIEK
jgi:OmpA-OmpF porin, OOP family